MRALKHFVLTIIVISTLLSAGLVSASTTTNELEPSDGWVNRYVNGLVFTTPENWLYWSEDRGGSLESVLEEVDPNLRPDFYIAMLGDTFQSLRAAAFYPGLVDDVAVRVELFTYPFVGIPQEALKEIQEYNDQRYADPFLIETINGLLVGYSYEANTSFSQSTLTFVYPMPDRGVMALLLIRAPTYAWKAWHLDFIKIASSLVCLGDQRQDNWWRSIVDPYALPMESA